MARRIGKLECCRVNANRVGQGAAKKGVLIAVPPSKAVDWLERAYRDRSNAIVFSRVDPQLDPLRSTPRFQSLLHRLALQN